MTVRAAGPVPSGLASWGTGTSRVRKTMLHVSNAPVKVDGMRYTIYQHLRFNVLAGHVCRGRAIGWRGLLCLRVGPIVQGVEPSSPVEVMMPEAA
jgi:hypothetical protein